MPIRKSKHIPFAERKRTAQKRAYQNVLNNIRRSAPMLGGKFYSRHYMHGENSWIDGYFLGTHKPTFYNFCLQTTRYAYKEKVVDLAWDKSYLVAPVESDLSIFDRTVLDPVSGLYVTPAHQPHRYPELNGMTRLEWTQAQLPKIANNQEVQVFENWTLHYDYHSGIGLHATIDVPYLTIDAVNLFIDRFLQSESAMVGTVALSYRHDQIGHWGIEPNSIADPWEWGSGDPQDSDESVGSQNEVDPNLQRAVDAIEKTVQRGDGIPAEEVIAKLEARIEAARAKQALRHHE
jgi:hypothetical protein